MELELICFYDGPRRSDDDNGDYGDGLALPSQERLNEMTPPTMSDD